MDNAKTATAALLVSGLFGLAASPALGDDDHNRIQARLSGYEEVHFVAGPPAAQRGAISTTGRGTFRATIDKNGELIRYRLTFAGLEGDITQAHIHFGQQATVGGIVVWLCQTMGTPAPAAVAALTPQCGEMAREGKVEGTIAPAQVLPQLAQGIEAGAFGELVRAIRAGATYANIHTVLYPPGEVRGQVSHH
jgi:hypothetical protein